MDPIDVVRKQVVYFGPKEEVNNLIILLQHAIKTNFTNVETALGVEDFGGETAICPYVRSAHHKILELKKENRNLNEQLDGLYGPSEE
jgi:hypothetical protein